jgi:hypothetical protein
VLVGIRTLVDPAKPEDVKQVHALQDAMPLFTSAAPRTAQRTTCRITPGWNYTERLYRPRKEILDGTWKFPEPQPVK